jgi:hypothetical protein
MYTTTMNQIPHADVPRTKKLLRRLGIAGFAFFFIKGMLWILVPAAIYLFRG